MSVHICVRHYYYYEPFLVVLLVQLIYAPLRRQRVVNFWSLRGKNTDTHTLTYCGTYKLTLMRTHLNTIIIIIETIYKLKSHKSWHKN